MWDNPHLGNVRKLKYKSGIGGGLLTDDNCWKETEGEGEITKTILKITDFGIYNFYYQFQQFNIFSLAVPNTIF